MEEIRANPTCRNKGDPTIKSSQKYLRVKAYGIWDCDQCLFFVPCRYFASNWALPLEVGRRAFLLLCMVPFMASEIKTNRRRKSTQATLSQKLESLNNSHGNWATSRIPKDCLNHLECEFNTLIPEHCSKPTEQNFQEFPSFLSASWVILIQMDHSLRNTALEDKITRLCCLD